jgi:hypothetical protein
LRVVNGLFEGLTRYDPVTARPIPGLAESWEISPDGRVYLFHLRDKLLLVARAAHHRGGRGLFVAARARSANRLRICRPALLSEEC